MPVDLMAAIRRRYAPPEYQVFGEFSFFEGARRLDALAMSPWPARGYHIAGFELKENRADWLRELKQPEKAEEGMAHCDRWWLVAPKGVAELAEIPKPWGYLELRGNRLFTLREAADLTPVPIDRAFCARVLTHLVDRLHRQEWEREAEVTKKVREQVEARTNQKEERTRKDFEYEISNLKDRIRRFEEKSGVSIDSYDGLRIGAAVKQVLAGQQSLPDLQFHENQLVVALRHVKDARAALLTLGEAKT